MDGGNVLRSKGKQSEVENLRRLPLNFQNVNFILYTSYQRNSIGYGYVFGAQLSNKDSGNVVREDTGNGKSNMATTKMESLLLACRLDKNAI